jgi:hypothetical protein
MAGTNNTLCQDLVAVWALATTRYYAADYVNGNDGNVGYSDVSMTAAGTVAVKTLTRLRAIIPDLGDGRPIVVAINGSADGITDLQYLKSDGVTLDNLDLRGISGYRYCLVRSTNGFANDATDKKVCATAVGQAGPGTGGAWTCAAGATTNVFTVSSGTLNAELLGAGSDNGFRVRFTGNVTAGLANQAFMIQRNTATQITLSRALSLTPAVGDTFVIERPGVSVDNIFVNCSVASAGGLASISVVPLVIVGIRARQTTVSQQFIGSLTAPINISFCDFGQCLSMRSCAQVNIVRSYVDEAGTSISPGVGLRWLQTATVNVIAADINQLLNIQDSAILSLGGASVITRSSSLSFGAGCYVNTNGQTLTFSSCGSVRARMALIGRMISASSSVVFNGIDLNSAGGNPCITLTDALGANSSNFQNLFSSGGGNTDVVIDYTGMFTSQFRFFGTLTAAMATLGDVRVAGPAIQTFAAVAAGITDANGNVSRA